VRIVSGFDNTFNINHFLSFLVGTKELYDFVDNNPFIEMLEINYVNDTKVVCQNPKMTAINR
jgi:acyl-CoA hydrolase